jgi:hypothetical protein
VRQGGHLRIDVSVLQSSTTPSSRSVSQARQRFREPVVRYLGKKEEPASTQQFQMVRDRRSKILKTTRIFKAFQQIYICTIKQLKRELFDCHNQTYLRVRRVDTSHAPVVWGERIEKVALRATSMVATEGSIKCYEAISVLLLSEKPTYASLSEGSSCLKSTNRYKNTEVL